MLVAAGGGLELRSGVLPLEVLKRRIKEPLRFWRVAGALAAKAAELVADDVEDEAD